MLKKLLLGVLGFVMTVSMAIAAVNINTASEQELDALPGVGPVKAKAIVDYRKKNGNFKSLDDIKNVSGIGQATFDGLKGQIALSGTTTVPESKPAAAKEKVKEAAKDTKEKVKETAKDTKDAVKDTAKDAAKGSKKAAKEVKEDVKAGADKAEDKVKKVAKKADKTADQSAPKAKK
jgi:competence protein ComEA